MPNQILSAKNKTKKNKNHPYQTLINQPFVLWDGLQRGELM